MDKALAGLTTVEEIMRVAYCVMCDRDTGRCLSLLREAVQRQAQTYNYSGPTTDAAPDGALTATEHAPLSFKIPRLSGEHYL